jgi:hypothetical protein
MPATRGRPELLTYDFCQTFYVRFEAFRTRLSSPSGRPASIRRVAGVFATHGGVANIIGGDKEQLALRLEFIRNARLTHLRLNPNSPPTTIYATHVWRESHRIRNLYYEAVKWTADPNVAFAWANMVRDLVGQPREIRPRSLIHTAPRVAWCG